MNDQQTLNNLKFKRANLLVQLDMLSSVSNEFYQKLGKVEADIFILERKIIRETKNDFEE